MKIALFIIIGIITFAILSMIVVYCIIASIILSHLVVRNNKNPCNRECSSKDDKEQVKMFDDGILWGEKYKEYKTEVSISNDGLKLVGEYFDFGKKKCAIIVQGRTESLLYSYYFSEPYREAGYNILVIDPRAHGLSEGKYNTLGFNEYRDLLKWAELVHTTYNNEKVLMHGICIGSASALYAFVNKKAPDYLEALVADGMYASFSESVKEHIIERSKPTFPTMFFINLVYFFQHGKIIKYGPINCINKMHKPMLFLHSKMDTYSLPKRANDLYNKCSSEVKQITFFDKGVHSHIRINNTEKYDTTIKEFIKTYLDK